MTVHKRFLLFFLLVLAAVPAYWLSRNLTSAPDPDELLPADTLLFVHWNNFTRFSQGLAQSPMAMQMQQTGFTRDMQQLGLDSALISYFDRGAMLLQSLNSVPLIQEVLQRRGMLALLPNQAPDLGLVDSICASLIFILPEHDAAANESIQALIDASSPVQTQEYQGALITAKRLRSGRSLYSSTIHNFTLYAFAQGPIHRCLDQVVSRMLGGAQAAHGQKNWQHQHRIVPQEEGEFFFYADAHALRSQPLWEHALFPLWQGLLSQQVIVAHAIDGNHTGLSATLRFKTDELNAWLQKHGLKASAQPPLNVSPDPATLLHFWTNWFTPEVLHRFVAAVNNTELGAPLFAVAKDFFDQASLSEEEFYRLFATELGLVIRGEKNQNGTLKPLFSLYFTGQDMAVVHERLQRLFSGFPLRKVELEYGTEAVTFSMVGGLIQPAFAVIGRHLLLADNLHMVQQMATRLRKGGEKATALDNVGKEVPVHASCYLFIRNKQVAEGTSQLLQYLVSAKNEKGVAILRDRQKLFVRQLALPMLATAGKAESSRFFLGAEEGTVWAEWQFFLE